MISDKTTYSSTLFITNSYRYGFNGMENDDEVSGKGRHPQFGDFGYDPATGRRWDRDPITYPWQSSYAIFNNNPILYMDETGKQGTPGKMLQNGVYSPATTSTYVKPATSKNIQFNIQSPYQPSNEFPLSGEIGVKYKNTKASVDAEGNFTFGAEKGDFGADYNTKDNELTFSYNTAQYSTDVRGDNTVNVKVQYNTQLLSSTKIEGKRGFMFFLGINIAGYLIEKEQNKYIVSLPQGGKYERTINIVKETAAWLGRKVERQIYYDNASGQVLSDKYRDVIEVGAEFLKGSAFAKLSYTTEWKDMPDNMKDYRQNNYYKPVQDDSKNGK